MVVHRGIGLPDKFRTRLIWNQAVVLTGFSSAHQSYAVRLNGPYDPQVALGGSQPQYYDMLLLACIARTWYGCKDFFVHLVLRPAVLLAMGLMWLVSCGRAAALVTTNPSILTQMPNTGYNYVTEWKFRFGYTNV